MTDHRDESLGPQIAPTDQEVAPDRKAAITRRSLLRGASVAAPTILTLNSNAAFGWAVASGTIGTRGASSGATGDAVCLDLAEATPAGKAGVYQADTSSLVAVRGDLEYRLGPLEDKDGVQTPTGRTLNAEEVCQWSGEPIYFFDGTAWQQINGFQGAVVSVSMANSASFSLQNLPTYPV